MESLLSTLQNITEKMHKDAKMIYLPIIFYNVW